MNAQLTIYLYYVYVYLYSASRKHQKVDKKHTRIKKCWNVSWAEGSHDENVLKLSDTTIWRFLTLWTHRQSTGQLGAVHKVRHAILDQFWLPSLCHTLSHISDPPTFSRLVHAYIHTSLHGVWLSSRGFLFWEFCPGFCLEGFVRPPSVIIHLCQQKAKNHSQF